MKKLSEKDRRLHEQFSTYGKNAREWMRKCVLLLPEIERNRVWEKKGFRDIYEYSAKLAGMNRDTVNDSLRVLRKIEDKPLLMKVVEQKGINCIKPIVNLINENNQKFWAEKAKIMSQHTLAAYAKAICEQEQRGAPSGNTNFTHQKAVLSFDFPEISTIQLSSKIKEKLEKLKGEKSWDNLFEQFLKLHEKEIERLKKEAEEKFEEMEMIAKRSRKTGEIKNDSKVLHEKSINKKSRYIPAKIKKYVISKTNGTCTFPGCAKQAEILHHTERFAITHKHNPNKIVPLCRDHERMAHLGLIENEERSPSEWVTKREPDKIDYKYLIDNMVAEYRK